MSPSKRSKSSKENLSSFLIYVCLSISLLLFLPYNFIAETADQSYEYAKDHIPGFEAEDRCLSVRIRI